MKNDRLFALLYLLLEKGSMTAPELAERLEVSVRTIYRDVETLSGTGIPVYATQGKGGGIALLPGYTFDRGMFSGDEQNQLLFALQSLQAADQQVDGLLHKLGSAFGKPPPDWISVEFSRWGLHRADTERFEQIKNAILQTQVLEMTYCGSSGETTRRQLHPLRLVYKDKAWYLQGYCLRAQDFRLFKVSRMLELVPTGQHFARDFAGELPPLESQPAPCCGTHLRLRFAPGVAFRVYDEFDRQSIAPQPDGSLLAEADFPMDSWVVSYLFSFGADVEVLEPTELRGQLAAYAEKILQHYRT